MTAQIAAQSERQAVERVAILGWAETISNDDRLQELVMLVTAMDVERIDALLALARGLSSVEVKS